MAALSDIDRNQLIVDHVDIARRIARGFAARVRAPAWEPDIVGAVLEALVRAAGRYDPDYGIPFTSFCARPLKGAAIDQWRQIVHHHRVGVNGGGLPCYLPPGFDAPATALSVEEIAMRSGAVGRLPPDDVKIVLSVYVHGRKKQDVAADLGIVPSAVSHRLGEIRSKLAAASR